ncbi:MAG: RNA 2'-phosphotransferase [Deltaproteobacteria bacterium]|nr:RNA 2'-phosphotransferase [Deltaproteobacteria bacterium]
MTHQRIKQQRDSLSRFLTYVLGIRPDEFGLVPDEQGYVPVKELLMALSEEKDWRQVRDSHIQELLRLPGQSDLEINGKLIRLSPEVSSLTYGPRSPALPPKLLFCAVRRKAYPSILEKGLTPTSRPWIAMTTAQDLALRIGRRRDQDPVMLTVLADKAHDRGVVFFRPQELIYFTDALAPDLFTGPPLPKEKIETEKKKKETPSATQPTSGSFIPTPGHVFELGAMPDKSKKRKKGDEPDWKKAARKERRKREY